MVNSKFRFSSTSDSELSGSENAKLDSTLEEQRNGHQ